MRFVLLAALGLVAAASPVVALPPVTTPLQAVSVTANTAEKPQSKVWTHDGRWWCVLPNATGTWIWRLDGSTWTSIYRLSTSTSVKADVKSAGDAVHVLLYQGTASALASAEYVPATQTYQAWSPRPANASITLDSGVETATLDIDSQGRMWLASDETDDIMVRYSDSPYSAWSAPIPLATGVSSDDVCVVTALPNGTVGVLWSNQATQRFGFRAHVDGTDPAIWSADEVPASQSALPIGLGMADDHLNVAVASDATLYAAVKTSYDTAGYPKVALLVRRPNGTWDGLYEVDQAGTRGICLLDEGAGTVTVVYTSVEGSGNIVYKESSTSSIAFGSTRSTLISGALNEVSSTKQNVAGSVVLLASTTSAPLQVVGVLRSGADVTPPSVTLTAPNGGEVWTVGSGRDITWTATDDVAVTTVDLAYSTDGGTGWTPIASGLANTGTYAWSVPNAPTTQARVRAIAHDGADNQGQDTSDGDFEIRAATVTHTITASAGPNGTIAPAGAVVVSDGANATFVITPDPTYHVADVLVDGGSAGAVTSYTFTNVTTDHTIAASFAPDVAPGDLAAWWPFEEGSGTAVLDASGLGNDGTLPAGGAWTTGAQGLALVLNGTNQYASVPDDASLDITSAITLAAWIRPGKTGTQNVIAKAVFGVTNGYELNLSSPGKPFMRFNQATSGDTYRLNAATSYPADGSTWMHIAATYDGATMRMYVNGALDASAPATFTIATNTLPLAIGAQSDGAASRIFQGAIDEARVYGRALSLAEIQALLDHTITASAGPNGSITPSGAVTVAHGGSAAFTIAADPGYFIADVLVDGASVGAVPSYTFTNVTRSHTIAATFSDATHIITASAGPGGSISPAGAISVPNGGSQSFTITPDPGYHITDVTVDGISQGVVASYTFTNVLADHTIAASFALDGTLVGWWPMEEGSGTTVQDVSGQGNHGTLPNGALWTPGVAGLALEVNGTNQYASVPANAGFDMTTAITMAAWIRPEKFATQDLIKKAVNGGSNGYELSLSAPSSSWPQKVFVRFNQVTSGDTYRVNSTTLYPYDGTTWIHVAATYDGATMRLYVNGVLEGSLPMAVPIATNANPLGIGAQSDGARGFQGAMDDVRLYGRALSATEIQALLGHTISASAGPGGSIGPVGTVPVHHGAAQTFTIAADGCHTLADVLVDGGSVGPVTSYTFSNVTDDHTIAASFALRTFTIVASAGAGGTVGPSGSVVVDCGQDQAFAIAPDPGYAVADVLVDGGSVGPVTSHTFTNVQQDHTLVASFVDSRAPVISAVSATPSANSATVTWTTDEPGSSRVDYGTDPGTLSSSASSGVLETAHGLTLAPLAPGTIYYFRVTSADGAGNPATYPAPPDPPASFATSSLDQVAAAPAPGSAISTATPCVTVPVVYTRMDATPVMGYSVTIELSANLSLCGAQFASAGYTQAPRQFLVTPLGGNRWTVDDVTLGSPCGATGSGTLFTLGVTSSETSGAGTITVLSVMARDCVNQPVPAYAGAPATVTIDREGPARTLDLVAIQSKTGNYVAPPSPPHATTPLSLQFTLPVDAASVEVYRRPFGGYPQYDENGGAVPVPPAALPDADWTLTGVTGPGQSDEPAARDFWYYALVTRDAHGNPSPVSNLTAGTLNYYLGDVSTGSEGCAGDDRVNSADVSMLGSHYGASVPLNDSLECLDVGPTTDLTADGRPMTDNVVEFEDLVLFALGYDVVSSPQLAAEPQGAAQETGGAERLTLTVPRQVTAGAVFEARIDLRASGLLYALSVALDWSRAVAEPISVQSGGVFENVGGATFVAGPAGMDGSLLGAARPGLAGEGVFAIVRFRALADGDPVVRLGRVRARDRENQPVVIDDLPELAAAAPVENRLLPAMPTPFTSRTRIGYSLAAETDVELAVFGIEGRRVRTLQRGSQPAGVHQVTWDGTDDRGRAVAAGVYYARLTVGPTRFSQLLVRLAR